ncbi:tetratricopeptide repeat protein [Janthinobacterium fluminis]|uniref:Tetratricopeptide repeat protein n=1 Tax=Janthinobacterium fluminis TaxID=2987524 RepID=A0ABT5JWB1_9BURK|nr:tetratricopeptide repeat protein [Janthinobacterium fluminis]MDC8756839.1 tetratricopeptide repeat protein [Janthinobacterium fluminis]
MKTSTPLAAALLLAAAAASGANCDDYVRHNPGGDYTNADDRQGLEVVEKFHFSKDVENLVRGMSASLGGDIGYTLEHFPNHHRALAAMAKLGLRGKTAQPAGAKYSVACYFERAIRFKQDDAAVRSIYGSYLLAGGHADAALQQLREAAQLAPEQPTIQYNLGLMYAKKKEYAQALAHAHKAYALGFPLPGLKNKLLAAGQWREPPARDGGAAPD